MNEERYEEAKAFFGIKNKELIGLYVRAHKLGLDMEVLAEGTKHEDDYKGLLAYITALEIGDITGEVVQRRTILGKTYNLNYLKIPLEELNKWLDLRIVGPQKVKVLAIGNPFIQKDNKYVTL